MNSLPSVDLNTTPLDLRAALPHSTNAVQLQTFRAIGLGLTGFHAFLVLAHPAAAANSSKSA
jgi:hypothetical protein